MISALKIDDFPEKFFALEDDSISGLHNLSTINIMIGANNTGKSRFLRTLFTEKLTVQLKEFDSSKLSFLIRKIKEATEDYLKLKIQNPDAKRLYDLITKLPDGEYINDAALIKQIPDQIDQILNYSNAYSSHSGIDSGVIVNDVRGRVRPLSLEISRLCQSLNADLLKYSKAYIPTLRGLRPLQRKTDSYDIENNSYRDRVKEDYFKDVELNENLQIYTGLDLYTKVVSMLLGDSSDRLKIKQFENFLSTTFFDNAPVNIVSRFKSDVLFVKIGHEELPIQNLGDGIQSIILLTYPLYFNIGKRILFFIEEPETHLHPGLQRTLVETLLNPLFKTYQFFISTHSNHFLDLTLEYDDISVFSFKKTIKNDTSTVYIKNSSSSQKQVLDFLGVRNSSLLLANCTIWVEGITDRLYLRKYLEIMQANRPGSLKEDYHYAFIEYAGNNITHWSFLDPEDEEFPNINYESICSKIFLIADNDGIDLPNVDNTKIKKKERINKLQTRLNERFYCLKCREVENLLKKDIIKKVIEEREKNNSSNLDFRYFDSQPHSSISLGKFIETNVENLSKKYQNAKGTVYDKVDFCKKALKYITSEDDLSSEAKDLSKKNNNLH